MYYLKCKSCGYQNEIKTEFQIFCSSCGKKMENNFKEWEKRNSSKSFKDFLSLECTTEKEEVIIKKESNRKGVKYWFTFGLVFIVCYAIAHLAIYTITNYTSTAEVNKKLVLVANAINKTTPLTLDQYTQLDCATALPNKTLQYNYTISTTKDEVDVETVKESIEPGIINNIKTNPQMAELREMGVTFNYYYKDKNGVFLLLIQVTPDMYK